METIDDPALQACFVRTRGRAGVRIVGLREARRELLDALRDGIPVGLVGDRDLTGGGIADPAVRGPGRRCRSGPAMLAVESGAPTYVDRPSGGPGSAAIAAGSIRDRRPGRGHAARARDGDDDAAWRPPSSGLIADAPEQWWAIFFPIWPDLEAARRRAAAEAAA